jgi:two-component system cell cycle sensor histidine kinase/response regulator CckA
VQDIFGSSTSSPSVFANNFLFELAHSIGKSDYQHYSNKLKILGMADTMLAGPAHFAYSGWANVNLKASPSCVEK